MSKSKVHEERDAQMVELRRRGHTNKMIAEQFGVSCQRVNQILAERSEGRFRGWSEERCVHDGMRNWLNTNKISCSELGRILYGHNLDGYSRESLARTLRGKKEFKLSTINKLIDVSGMTFEQLFREGAT